MAYFQLLNGQLLATLHNRFLDLNCTPQVRVGRVEKYPHLYSSLNLVIERTLRITVKKSPGEKIKIALYNII